jgi:hypothetical protein
MAHGLQAPVSCSFAKSSDLGSNDENGLVAASVSQMVLPPLTPSDFDIRHSIARGHLVRSPGAWLGPHGNAILKGSAVDGLARLNSAPPINVKTYGFSFVSGYHLTEVGIVSGQPTWIYSARR